MHCSETPDTSFFACLTGLKALMGQLFLYVQHHDVTEWFSVVSLITVRAKSKKYCLHNNDIITNGNVTKASLPQ